MDNATEDQQRAPVALVTGGARRIGADICRTLHAAGYRILVHYQTSADDAARLAGELNQNRSGSVATLAGNLAESGVPEAIASTALETFGRLDVLINNASSFYPTPVGSITETDWDNLTGSNLKGPLFLTQALAGELARNRGSVINIVDIHAERPMAEHTVYCAAKAGLAMLTRSLAHELAPTVRVNGVSPGAILWPEAGTDSDLAERQQKILRRIPLQRPGEPKDIAGAVLFLVRDAGYITGQILAVDGGRTLSM